MEIESFHFTVTKMKINKHNNVYLKIQFSNCEAPGMEKLAFLQHAARILTNTKNGPILKPLY